MFVDILKLHLSHFYSAHPARHNRETSVRIASNHTGIRYWHWSVHVPVCVVINKQIGRLIYTLTRNVMLLKSIFREQVLRIQTWFNFLNRVCRNQLLHSR